MTDDLGEHLPPAERFRFLAAQGRTQADIARLCGVKRQRVHAALKSPLKPDDKAVNDKVALLASLVPNQPTLTDWTRWQFYHVSRLISEERFEARQFSGGLVVMRVD